MCYLWGKCVERMAQWCAMQFNMKSVTSDGFQVVRSRRRSSQETGRNSRRDKLVTPFVRTEADFPNVEINQTTAIRRIFAAKEDFQESDYYKSFFITLVESLQYIDCSNVVEIVSYGLGHIGDSTVSRYQLSLILCLKDHFKVDCYAHDPIFYSDECEVLQNLGISLIHENEEGKRELRTDGQTIVFLPHCPKQLTNNFLWKNWSTNLKNCILICNSFISLIETQPHHLLNDSAPCILDISAYTKEFSLVNSFKFNNVFNDTAIHVFPEEFLNSITKNFWDKGQSEPQYSQGVELITSESIKNLRILK